MNSLIRNEIGKIIKRVDTRALLLLSVWPLLLSVLVVVKDDVFKMEGDAIGAFEYTNYMVIIQNDIFLPLLLTVLIASVSLYQEVQKKTIYFYKDIARKDILKAKYVSVFSMYFLFLFSYILMSFASYYLAFCHHSMATGTFISYPTEVIDMLYTAIQVILGATLYIHVGITFALRTSTGMTIFGTTMFYMFARIVPNFKFLKLVFPIGYKEVLEVTAHPYMCSLLLSLLVYAVYHAVIYYFNRRTFERMQFN